MADLTIRLKTSVDGSGAEQEINNLINKLNNKQINLKTNASTVANELNNVNNTLNNGTINSANNATRAINNTAKAVNILGTTTKRTNGFATNLYSTLSMYTMGNLIARQLTKAISSVGSTILDTDTAIKKVLKVAPADFTGTEAQLDGLMKKATEAGQEVARSSIDIINSTANALQSGFHNVNKAVEFAKNSSMFANVIDVDQNKADIYLKSVLASYGGITKALDDVQEKIPGVTKGYSNMMKMMDMINYANNNYALTGADVAEAMKRSASVANTLGVSMEELVGIIIAGQEPLQNASKLGNGLKTIMQNMAGWKTSAKDGSISMNKTALAIEKIAKIDIHDSTGQVKDFYTIMDEISKKWDSLSKKDKSALSEAVAGK